MTSFPKLIFQTWKSKTDIPENFVHWSGTLRSENPDYAYRLWDDADNRAFIAKNYPWFLERYDSYPAEIYRVDAVRYFFLFQFGGIYADMDVECLRPLDEVMALDTDVVFGRMGPNPNFEHCIPNALMFSRPRQEFWLLVMSLMFDPPAIITNDRPEYRTGPVLLKLAHDLYATQYREDAVQNRIANIRMRVAETIPASPARTRVTVLSAPVLYPLDWNDKVHDNFVRKPILNEGRYLDRQSALQLFPSSLTVTYWSHSWEDQND